jgi:hypothetical protein
VVTGVGGEPVANRSPADVAAGRAGGAAPLAMYTAQTSLSSPGRMVPKIRASAMTSTRVFSVTNCSGVHWRGPICWQGIRVENQIQKILNFKIIAVDNVYLHT